MRRAGWLLLGLSMACGARVRMNGPAMNARRESNFITVASRALSCPGGGLQVGYVQSYERNAHLYRARGCGGTYESILDCTGTCSWNEVPRARAAMEMQCPPEQIAWSYTGVAALSFAGCGAVATYHYVNGEIVSDGVRH